MVIIGGIHGQEGFINYENTCMEGKSWEIRLTQLHVDGLDQDILENTVDQGNTSQELGSLKAEYDVQRIGGTKQVDIGTTGDSEPSSSIDQEENDDIQGVQVWNLKHKVSDPVENILSTF